MASYFDEHNCEPLREGQTPDHLLHLARMLQDGGFVEEFEELFGQIDSSPPASKDVIANLPDVVSMVQFQVKFKLTGESRPVYSFTSQDHPFSLVAGASH